MEPASLGDSLKSPVNRAALAYWESIRKGRPMPSRADLDPADIVELLPQVFLLDVQQEPLNFRYRLVGTMMDDHMTGAYTGLWMRQIPHQCPPSRIWSSCEQVATGRQPISSDVPYVGKNRDILSTEDLIMPLSDDQETVNMLFVTVGFI